MSADPETGCVLLAVFVLTLLLFAATTALLVLT